MPSPCPCLFGAISFICEIWQWLMKYRKKLERAELRDISCILWCWAPPPPKFI